MDFSGLTSQLMNKNYTTTFQTQGMVSPAQSSVSATGNNYKPNSMQGISKGLQFFGKSQQDVKGDQSQWWGSQYQDVARDNQDQGGMMTAMLQKMFTNPAIIQLLQSRLQGASNGGGLRKY